MRARLEAAEARVLARWDANRCWQVDGAHSGAAWLAGSVGCRSPSPTSACVRPERCARSRRSPPPGRLARSTARTSPPCSLSARRARRRRSSRPQGAARRRPHPVLQLLPARVPVLGQPADPDGAEDRAAAERAAREVHLSPSFDGMFFGGMTFDPVSGEIVSGTMRIIEQELFEADWAEAKERLGREPMIFDLRRNAGQRRADALVEMAIRARTAPVGGRRPAPLFTIVAGYETFAGPVCELWNRTVVTPGHGGCVAGTGGDRASGVRRGVPRDRRGARAGSSEAPCRAIEVRDRTCSTPRATTHPSERRSTTSWRAPRAATPPR